MHKLLLHGTWRNIAMIVFTWAIVAVFPALAMGKTTSLDLMSFSKKCIGNTIDRQLLAGNHHRRDSFSEQQGRLKKNLKECQRCFNITTTDLCDICANEKRDGTKIMVVEEPLDIVALEKTDYSGLYHVLGGQISPIDGIGPENLRIAPLLERITKEQTEELILSTDPSLEGEATAMYIAKQVEKLKKENSKLKNLKVTRIARGLPVGSDLEYADEITLTRALEGRREY